MNRVVTSGSANTLEPRREGLSIFVNAQLPLGSQALAAAHAAVAWGRLHGQGSPLQVLSSLNIIEGVDTPRLIALASEAGSLSFTEGGDPTLTAVARTIPADQSLCGVLRHSVLGWNLDDPSVKRAEGAQQPARAHRMYVVVDRDLPRTSMIQLVAGAALASFWQFREMQETQTWVAGKFYKIVCSSTLSELKDLCAMGLAHVRLCSEAGGDPQVAAFAPKTMWPKRFADLQLLG